MTSNAIKASVKIGTIIRGGKEVSVEIATQTQKWNRPTDQVLTQKTGFSSAIAHSLKDLPEGTAEIIGRDAEHASEKDPVMHYSAVCRDKFQKWIKTLHLYDNKKK